jgi:ribonuclease D
VTTDDFQLINSECEWERCLQRLAQAPRIAVDIEANSLYAYREKICLIQISTDECDYIIDPLAGFSLQPLGALFADPKIEKVFHAADYDLSLLKGLYGWEVNGLFDTMWAGRILGFKKMGLAWFLETLYGITVSKKCQKADWAHRPLSQEKLEYARNDTHYLLPMRDDLGVRLKAEGHEAEALEVFDELRQGEGAARTFNPDDFWKLKGVRHMTPRAQAVLKSLFIYRDREARHRDVPPFKVINNQMLLQIAQETASWNKNPPKKITSIPGVPDKLMERLNPGAAKAIISGLRAPVPIFSTTPHEGTPGYWQRYEVLMQWRKDMARKRGVESDVILGRKALDEIAEKGPKTLEELADIQALGAWRRNQYGDSILKALA